MTTNNQGVTPEHLRNLGNLPTPTNNQNSLDELVDDIIALGTDHPNGAFPDGRKPDGTFAPQTKEQALAAINKTIMEEVGKILDSKRHSWETRRGDLTDFYDGYDKALDDVRESFNKKYGRADNE